MKQQEESTVFARPTYDVEIPLGNPQVLFRAAGVTYCVSFDPATGELMIDAESGRLAVYPNVTNSVTVKQERY
jgi:hypothetical protein